jgi:hypothetical protein
MNKDWFFFHADLKEAQRCFDGEQDDFTYFIHLLGWKSGAKHQEVVQEYDEDE